MDEPYAVDATHNGILTAPKSVQEKTTESSSRPVSEVVFLLSSFVSNGNYQLPFILTPAYVIPHTIAPPTEAGPIIINVATPLHFSISTTILSS